MVVHGIVHGCMGGVGGGDVVGDSSFTRAPKLLNLFRLVT